MTSSPDSPDGAGRVATAPEQHVDRSSGRNLLLLVVVACVAFNLRPFMTGVGPLAGSIGADLGLDLQGIALLTLVPMLLMGICAFAGPALQAGLGARRAVVAALIVLGLGSFLRLFVSTGWAMVGTAALLGLGAAMVQSVFPGVVKRHFPRHLGLVMGLYSAMLMGGGALGAQVSPLVAGWAGGWRIGLGWLAAPALLAAVLVVCLLPRDAASSKPVRLGKDILGRPRVWLLMACFGLINGGYATVVAWLAESYRELGWTAAASGSLLAALTICQACFALLIPSLAHRGRDRRPWIWLTLVLQAVGFAGLALQPTLMPLSSVLLLGAGLGGSFALSMVVALDDLPDPVEAGAVSALMQGGGFLISALPPWIVAVLHDVTGGFRAGWLLHLACVVVVASLTFWLSPRRHSRS